MGYLGIRKIFDTEKVNYSKNTIIQASDLKEKLEGLNIKRRTHTIASLDIEAMYPSIKFSLVEKAVNHFAANLSSENKKTIKLCLQLIKFGMSNTLLIFLDKYYEYGGSSNPSNRGLTIGGYKSAWLADLVASYILEKLHYLFE